MNTENNLLKTAQELDAYNGKKNTQRNSVSQSKRNICRALLPSLQKARNNGATFADIKEILQSNGFNISLATIRHVLDEKTSKSTTNKSTKERKKTAKKPAEKPTSEAKITTKIEPVAHKPNTKPETVNTLRPGEFAIKPDREIK